MIRLRPWLPLLSVATQLALVWLGAAWIESSDLRQQPGPWGYVFVTFFLTFMYASWPVLVTLGTAVAGTVSRSPGIRSGTTATGAVVAALVGLAGMGLGVAIGLGAQAEADTAFALVLGVAGVVPVVVAVLILRGLSTPAENVPVA